MVDTARTLAALKALLADNTAGAISPQDVRDAIESIVNPLAGGGFDTDIRRNVPNVFDTLDITTDTMTFRAPDGTDWDILLENKVGGLNEIWIHDQGPSRISLTSDGGIVEMHADAIGGASRSQVLVNEDNVLLVAQVPSGGTPRASIRLPDGASGIVADVPGVARMALDDAVGSWDFALTVTGGLGIYVNDSGAGGIDISSNGVSYFTSEELYLGSSGGYSALSFEGDFASLISGGAQVQFPALNGELSIYTLGAASKITMGVAGLGFLRAENAKLAFFNSLPVSKPTVTGSRGGNAALASLLTGLAALGLVTDSSS